MTGTGAAAAFTVNRRRRWHQLREKSRSRTLRGRRNVILPGQYYDAESGLNYNYTRYYDPALGRYAESDTIGLHGGVNTYAYVEGNPLGKMDPMGLCKVDLRFQPAAFVGWAGIYHAYIVTIDPNGTQSVFRGDQEAQPH
jgi:RHS repeat-associated protein